MEVDPQILFRLHHEAYLSKLDFVPEQVDVLEIYHYDVGLLVFPRLDSKILTIFFERVQHQE